MYPYYVTNYLNDYKKILRYTYNLNNTLLSYLRLMNVVLKWPLRDLDLLGHDSSAYITPTADYGPPPSISMTMMALRFPHPAVSGDLDHIVRQPGGRSVH